MAFTKTTYEKDWPPPHMHSCVLIHVQRLCPQQPHDGEQGNILSLRSFFAVHNQIQLIYTLAVEIHTDM